MKVGIPKEIVPGERRVAGVTKTVERLKKLGFEVLVESGAGQFANVSDAAYAAAGATVVPGPKELYGQADLILKVLAPVARPDLGVHEVDLMREGACLISFIWPAQNKELLERLAKRKVSAIAMDAIPRISRAQKSDALSSMANIAGYRAVLEAAAAFGSLFPPQMTAAGRSDAARVLVIGAGVAGLAAIATANNMGARVQAFDVRPQVREQVQSLGAEFLEVELEESGEGVGGYAKEMSKEFIDAEMALFRRLATQVDIIITTALIPGKRSPILITADMVRSMKPGSVVVDLAAEQGGNCELTEPGKSIVTHGVTIIGDTDLVSRLPTHASHLYGNNQVHLLEDMVRSGSFKIDLEDEVVRTALVTHEGNITWPPPKFAGPPTPAAPVKTAQSVADSKNVPAAPKKSLSGWIGLGLVVVLAGLLATSAPPSLLQHLTVFVLACFVGWQVIWNVTPALHTPLMSVTNAISGIILIGGMLQVRAEFSLPTILGAIAVVLASINVAGGFLVTQRMLRMFRK
ncbi:MAG: Re/Si-specific NAD(P)(+) transhydrogenase subunit alpha [Myxococcales bacterium]|nr:Re/Si-specific NAD(P)(+) transhydrogenase subunit alpha [Myxococcales bacterium]